MTASHKAIRKEMRRVIRERNAMRENIRMDCLDKGIGYEQAELTVASSVSYFEGILDGLCTAIKAIKGIM